MSESERQLILDALIWNYPALRRGPAEAQAFAAAMVEGAPVSESPDDEEAPMLLLAAHAVVAERAQDHERARELIGQLIANEDPWVRLTGLMLNGWSESSSEVSAIEAAHDQVRTLDDDPTLQARLLAKVATFAFDKGAIELGRTALSEALEAAPRGTSLHRALAVEAMNAGFEYEWKNDEPLPEPDPLVEYSWIEDIAHRAVRAALESEVEARGRRVWTTHFSMGRTPVDDAVSAELQATWAGALWMRRPIRKQLGGMLLSGAAETAPQWSFGVLMWALGSGKNPEAALALAEPHLDGQSADFIVRTLAESEISPQLSPRLLPVAVEAWDELSDEVLREMINMQPAPSDSEHPIANELRRLWAGYAARLTEEWLPRFQEFELGTQVALLEVIGTRMVSDFPEEAKRVVHEVIGRAIRESHELGDQLLMILSSSSARGVSDEAIAEVISERASSAAIAHLAQADRFDLIGKGGVRRARNELVARVRTEIDEARSGSVSFGREEPRLELGRLIASTDTDQEAIELLMEIATDPALPGRHLLQARTALMLIARAGMLGPDQRAALHDAADPEDEMIGFDGISAKLLEVSRLRILAEELRPEEALALVGLCRSQESRVRDLALTTCLEATQGEEFDGNEALAWSVVGGLFDPNDEVLEHVAAGIVAGFIHRHPAPGEVARARFPTLLEFGPMRQRATVRLRAIEWSEDESLNDELTANLLQRTAADRSWIVRNS